MEILQEVATISGKPGLFRIVKPGRAGVIVETLDTEKKREMVSANARVSVLKEISVYTTDFNVSKPLGEVFMTLKEQYPTIVELDIKKATTTDLFAFFEKVMPDFDKERVYPTDIKKIISWYNALSQNLPEAFEPEVKS
jgi:hypothetical protein